MKMYQQHVKTILAQIYQLLEDLKLPGVIIDCGQETVFFNDDQEVPYRQNPAFRHVCQTEGTNHQLLIEAGKEPVLNFYRPDDFWAEHPHVSEHCNGLFQINHHQSVETIWNAAKKNKNWAYLGAQPKKLQDCHIHCNPPKLVNGLNWVRTFKTPFEIHCLEEATRIAAKGHRAAKETFLGGKNELEIYFSYAAATGLYETQFPYPPIIALETYGSILHYRKKRTNLTNGRSLLIDAGAQYFGYASDVTRTHTTEHASDEFNALISDLNNAQQNLCRFAKPRINARELQLESTVQVSQILIDHKILLEQDVQRCLDDKLTRVFYPHGVSHMLGLQTHDVGYKQESRFSEPVTGSSNQRNMRVLEEGNVMTIEPGIYFNEVLMTPHRQNTADFNWEKIDRLREYGGIRIEDNILLTSDGHRNLTRPHIP